MFADRDPLSDFAAARLSRPTDFAGVADSTFSIGFFLRLSSFIIHLSSFAMSKPVSVRAGQVEFLKVNTEGWDWRDAYQWLLALSWTRFALFIAGIYVAINLTGDDLAKSSHFRHPLQPSRKLHRLSQAGLVR